MAKFAASGLTDLQIMRMMASSDLENARTRLIGDIETIAASCQRALRQLADGHTPEDPTSYSCIRDIPARMAQMAEIKNRIAVLDRLEGGE